MKEFYLRFIQMLNKYKVRYLLVGGQAVNIHGYPRTTMDMDLLVDKKEQNLEFLYQALLALDYEESKAKKAINYFAENHKINIPKNDGLIEILDSFIVKGDFNTLFAKKTNKNIEGCELSIIDIDSLIKIKSSSKRLQDLADAEKLIEINNKDHVEEEEEGYTLE